MRLISLLVGVLLVGLFIMKQLDSSSSVNENIHAVDTGDFKTPKVPTTPQGIAEFEGDMNKFIQDNADKRARELEDSLNR